MAFDGYSGGSTSSATTITASGGSQVVNGNGVLANPSSIAIGRRGTYASPGSVANVTIGRNGALTVQNGISPDLLNSALALANNQVNPGTSDPGSAVSQTIADNAQQTDQATQDAQKKKYLMIAGIIGAIAVVWLFFFDKSK